MRTYLTVRGGRASEVAAEVVREQPLTIYVNGEKFLTLLCSPMMLDALVIGYLWMEKVIAARIKFRWTMILPFFTATKAATRQTATRELSSA